MFWNFFSKFFLVGLWFRNKLVLLSLICGKTLGSKLRSLAIDEGLEGNLISIFLSHLFNSTKLEAPCSSFIFSLCVWLLEFSHLFMGMESWCLPRFKVWFLRHLGENWWVCFFLRFILEGGDLIWHYGRILGCTLRCLTKDEGHEWLIISIFCSFFLSQIFFRILRRGEQNLPLVPCKLKASMCFKGVRISYFFRVTNLGSPELFFIKSRIQGALISLCIFGLVWSPTSS